MTTFKAERSRSVSHILYIARHLRRGESEFGEPVAEIDAGGYAHKAVLRRYDTGKRLCFDPATGKLALKLGDGSITPVDCYCPTYRR